MRRTGAPTSEIGTVRDPLSSRSGIILIDPWFIADGSGRAKLASAVENLPSGVLPLLILDQSGHTRTRNSQAGLETFSAPPARCTRSHRSRPPAV